MEWKCHEISPYLQDEHFEAGSTRITEVLQRPSISSNKKMMITENDMSLNLPNLITTIYFYCYLLLHTTIASLVICADGGANRLYKFCEQRDTLDYFIPDFIKGDCDSVDQAVHEYYTKKGVPIITDPSQDSTDLMKAIEIVRDMEQQHEITFNNIFVSGGLGGGVHCSVVPIETVKEVTTTGLRWNLDRHEMKFGAMVSTSNITLDDITTIKTTGILIFIVDLIH
ncbi:hypothetical protein PPL_09551 [Heterostelium album PN500]|uniref:Thiamin pyrophosphokinase thiamin-binding domain-containing protein n=1 Tax=Heterostelium pallidum (strain ATCC 26659 / Pp 5 / PN500) TaxID=670386 RepID=D3BND9_HETP5|nr:hypothetical protein PPL_09551 [Heterostelium album PN500]EFA76799.1 hypothetical protein PPL_09551 [Heterostelium album PN500]|eukprot:XP_020428931.1 hypothetical protein PPL_09551 [Heterostelium album PN500]